MASNSSKTGGEKKQRKRATKTTEPETEETFEKRMLNEEAPTKRKRSVSPARSEASDEIDPPEFKLEGDGGQGNVSGEVSNLLKTFGASVSSKVSNKNKRLAQFSSASLRTSHQKYEEVFTSQQAERNHMGEEFTRQTGLVFTQWEADMSKSKEVEERMEEQIQKMLKVHKNQRVVQNHRQKALQALHEQFTQGLAAMAESHQEQRGGIHADLKKEMGDLQNKMMEKSRQEEISHVRKSLQHMLSQDF